MPNLLNVAVLGGAFLGTLIYYVHAWWNGRQVDRDLAIHATAGSALASGALHLMFCTICPSELVHLRAADGTPVSGVDVSLDTFHGLEIIIGGVAALHTAIVTVRRALAGEITSPI
jgi:hypothetical protein